MAVPFEFTLEAVEEASGPEAFRPYQAFLGSRQPVDSIVESNPWMKTPLRQEEVVWGDGRYYDTTVARKHARQIGNPTVDPGSTRSSLDSTGQVRAWR